MDLAIDWLPTASLLFMLIESLPILCTKCCFHQSACFLGFWFVISIVNFLLYYFGHYSPSPSNSRVFFFFFFSSQKFLIAWKQKKKKTRIFCHKWLMLYKIFIRKSGNFYFYFLGKCCHFWGLPKSLLSLCCCLEKSLRKLSSINATSTLECSLPTFLLQKKN